jgi:hypothetical protein
VRFSSIFTTLIVFLFAGSVSGQSLSEIAKKEKERRKENEKKAEQVQVITEHELQQGRRESTPSDDSAENATSQAQSSRSRATSSRSRAGATRPAEGGAPTEIPRDAEIREKIAIFEQMLTAHRAEVSRIDEEIAKNNTRIAEIDQELSTIGAGGLPVVPTVPQVDNRVRYEGEAWSLQAEQNELRKKNQQLEAQKRRSADELRQKGRRAGIPAGYLRF